ncbi:MAG: membrane protein FxsA [Candidatus Infernicultor aquiphilus]|uniref:Membrane protein FxsA n=1 Tax=Candidatus Infernicultor aquiphilus TaxID=1805029 RepID=A0A2M7KA83_9BACT|nr:MAG: membrane protein FxsA [Candidatus Atribacteria bacterium CG17_big_fil_post_rev_8_21_14_2_50_34_11]PIX35046.1 MAG: membrane protein FxsA [Candidatus Atribacteria bacterium CG_4_8_14_3_um_filter_34_18]PJB57799.1 MAG: membrane protein FxsA [Candidatus Atribacteria bacterium CG_4_9_14_3_um_filter_33_16]
MLFIAIPVVELYILIEVGKKIGSLTTIGIIILTGILGTYLIKSQGFMILRKIQNDLNEGIMPGDSLIQGAIILLGGVLLLTPGFITDIMGFIFLIPAGRKIVKKYLLKWLKGKIKKDNFYFKEF